MDQTVIDVLIVGSGASGVNAAAPLVEAGLTVAMLDVGNTDRRYGKLIPPLPFSRIRRENDYQIRYFLGDEFEGDPLGPDRVGAQLTPPRMFISADTATLMPVDSETFTPTESLALGGLAAGWGAGVFPFTDEDLAGMPLSCAELEPHCETVARRIGVSGARDDLLPLYGDCESLLPPLELDVNAQVMLAAYERRRTRLNARGFIMGRQRLAVCSVGHRDRGPHRYRDMEFWADVDRAVYRPQWTVEELQRYPNFTYLGGRFVLGFVEREHGIEVTAQRGADRSLEKHLARALVLAAGALGSARLVLRSLGRYDTSVPIVCNPYTYVPVVNLRMIGREATDR